MKLKKKLISVLLLASAGILISGCSEDELASSKNIRQDYDQASQKSLTYKLAYFEQTADDDLEDVHYALGYYKDGKVKKITGTTDDFNEVINPKIKTPYVTKNSNGELEVHRPPTNIYDYNKNNKLKGDNYQLGYFENILSHDDETQKWALGMYSRSGKLKSFVINSDAEQYSEDIDSKIKMPYVTVQDDGVYIIHRPPYMQYNEPIIQGKVSAKEK